jgi:hypothetical protein
MPVLEYSWCDASARVIRSELSPVPCLTPLAPRAAPAMAPAAGAGAAALRPSTWLSHVQRATFNLQPLAPHPLAPRASSPRAPHSRAPLPLIPPAPFSHKGRRGSLGVLMAETRDGTQGLAKKSTPVSSPPSPRASSPHAAAPLRPSTWSSHVQRATFNLQRLAPRASRLSFPCAFAPHPPNPLLPQGEKGESGHSDA